MSGRIDRRHVLAGGLALAGLGAAPSEARLTLGRPGHAVPRDFTGFSIETAALADPDLYHPANASLIALHRRLSLHGVLRFGGNTSDFCWWKESPDAATLQMLAQGRPRILGAHRFSAITQEALDHLRGFLDASGWSCIWGLNLGTGSPQMAAEEASYVAEALGPRLLYFQIGNEPDLYRHNGLRAPEWGFDNYFAEWCAFADAVSARVPDAGFAGPDIAAATDWVLRFAEAAPKRLGRRLTALSFHYYAEGPPDSPSATIANLLAPRSFPHVTEIARAGRAAGLPFRMTEGNSCYRGGQPGVSNAFASALWGGDYMLAMAEMGCAGINFHGGSGDRIAASLGGSLPGAHGAADLEVARLGAFYSPFEGDRETGFGARPLFYGMMLAEHFAGTRLIDCSLDRAGVNAAAYAAWMPGSALKIALFNKDLARDLTLRLDGLPPGPVTAWRLQAPSAEALAGLTLAGNGVAPGTADWATKSTGSLIAGEAFRLNIPRASAMLLFARR